MLDMNPVNCNADQCAKTGNRTFAQRCTGKNRLEQPERARLVWFCFSLGHSVNRADDKKTPAKPVGAKDYSLGG
jgi:hypothetical protein